MNLQDILFALSRAVGPSGAERGAADAAKELLRPYVRSVTRDVMGNLIGIRTAATRGAPCILLDAHLDEVGLIVTGHEEGFLTFTAIGVDPRILPGLEVLVLTDPPLRGVVSCPSQTCTKEPDDAFSMDQLVIDCGVMSSFCCFRYHNISFSFCNQPGDFGILRMHHQRCVCQAGFRKFFIGAAGVIHYFYARLINICQRFEFPCVSFAYQYCFTELQVAIGHVHDFFTGKGARDTA